MLMLTLLSFPITLTLSLGCLAPQDNAGAAAAPTVLAKSDHDTLRSRVHEYFKARAANRDADDGRREATRKKEDQAKEKLKKEWEAKSGKKNPLASVPDLRAIFTGCFEFERQTGTGDMRTLKSKERPSIEMVLSKKYRAEVATPAVLLMRGHDGKGWTPALDWYGSTWKAAAETPDFAFVLPMLDNSLDFDPPVDLTRPEGETADNGRRDAVLGALGAATQAVNIDRDRIYLDCGKGSCAYALRLASYFPHLFAGVVLRHPTDPGDLRLDNLGGVPILLVQTPETKDVCERLAAALNKIAEGTATVLEGKGSYPHAESASDIAAWLHGKRRNLLRPHVVVANTHDILRRAFWVFGGTFDALAEVPAEARPRLEVVADRAANTLTVTSRGVADFTVYLNDALLDLDKEITAIINGKAQPPFKVERSFNKLIDYVFNFRDSGMLFTADKTFVVPVEKTDKNKDTKGESPTPK
jgi:hypothetical protein